ncbi:MAG TPA: nuclear transport factor 2 family protein [Longimicrobium sp.]
MRHLATAALLLALAACKVERTPPGFYKERDPGRVEQQDAAGEIRVRVRSFADGLGRGDRADAVDALYPLDLAQVVGVDGNARLTRLGPVGLRQALDSLSLPAPAVARTPDLAVQVGLREGMGWFSTHLELLPTGAPAREPLWLRASGVFTRDRGAWRLAQLHLSRAWQPPDTTSADTTRADSAAADTAGKDETE